MQGDSLPIALDRATQFILQGIRATFGYEYNNLEGIMLEKVLHNLDMPIQISSYELVDKRPRESVHTYLPDGEFHFAEGYQGIEQTDMPVVSEGGDRDVRFFYLSGVEQVSALGSGQQRLCGGMPFASVPKGDVGDRGIGEESVAHDEYVVSRIAQSEGFVEHTTVGLLVAIVDVVLRHQLQTMYGADVVRKVFHTNHVAGIGQAATGCVRYRLPDGGSHTRGGRAQDRKKHGAYRSCGGRAARHATPYRLQCGAFQ